MDELQTFLTELEESVGFDATQERTYTDEALFGRFSQVLTEEGVVDNLDWCPYQGGPLTRPLRVDGYYLDRDTRKLTLAICDFRKSGKIETLVARDLEQNFRRCEGFFNRSLEPAFHQQLEETSPGYGLARFIFEERDRIKSVHMLLFSDARLATRREGIPSRNEAGRRFSFDVWDLQRLFAASETKEPIIVDVKSFGSDAVPCLKAQIRADDYEAYLMVMSGEMLSRIYDEFGARLLEQNVRTFLQARGAVNRGINDTIRNKPNMFFAYNNGIAATADSVETVKRDGGLAISQIHNFQIVNGGQTTASLLHANRANKADLSNICVQVKLSVVKPERLEEIVPKISKYANTQNRVNAADFYANHPFHVRVQEISRKQFTPPREGAFMRSKWFYERARGQYKDEQSRLTAAARKKFLVEYPKAQVFTKTDLAKFEASWDLKPHVVSLGAQKNFADFAKGLTKRWKDSTDSFNDLYFRRLIGKAILFRTVDKMVEKADWYDGGFKANIVTYSLAWLSHYTSSVLDREFDLEKIWNDQSVGTDLGKALETIAKAVFDSIVVTPEGKKNVTEWCKLSVCWDRVQKLSIDVTPNLKGYLISSAEVGRRSKNAEKERKTDDGIGAQTRILELAPLLPAAKEFGRRKMLIGPTEAGIIDYVISGKLASEGQATRLIGYLERIKAAGFTLPD